MGDWGIIRGTNTCAPLKAVRRGAVLPGLHMDDRIRDSIGPSGALWHQLTPERLAAD